MTLVAPALPTIVSELGGLADYSWVPISAMLASTIVVPIAGKLSDIYGRKPLYMSGIVVFAVGSALWGVAPTFWFLSFVRFMHVPNERRKHAIDVWGSVTLSTGIAAALLATVWGGTQFAWTSWQIIGLYAAAAILLGAFVWVERHAPEPVLPLHLFQSSIFTLSNIA